MAEQEFWFGSFGPGLYNDTDEYPDGVDFEGIRVDQGYIESLPTEDNHIATKAYVDAIASPELLAEIGAGRRMVQNHEATFNHVSLVGGLTNLASLLPEIGAGKRHQQMHEAVFDHRSIVSDLAINREEGRRFLQMQTVNPASDILANQIFS